MQTVLKLTSQSSSLYAFSTNGKYVDEFKENL